MRNLRKYNELGVNKIFEWKYAKSCENMRNCVGPGPMGRAQWAGPMGRAQWARAHGPWARAHGPGPGTRALSYGQELFSKTRS